MLENNKERIEIHMKCEINLTQNIEEEVKKCVKKAEIGPSSSGSKLYTCNSNCNCKTSNSNKAKFINSITKKLSSLRDVESCEIEISIGQAPVQNKSKPHGM